MATGKKEDDREAELEAAYREDPAGDLEGWTHAAEASPRYCPGPARTQTLMRRPQQALIGRVSQALLEGSLRNSTRVSWLLRKDNQGMPFMPRRHKKVEKTAHETNHEPGNAPCHPESCHLPLISFSPHPPIQGCLTWTPNQPKPNSTRSACSDPALGPDPIGLQLGFHLSKEVMAGLWEA